jgi:hypothetical protein
MKLDITQKFRSLFGDWLNPNLETINLYYLEAELEGIFIREIVLEFGDELTLPLTDLRDVQNGSGKLLFEDGSSLNQVEEKLAQLDKLELASSLFQTFTNTDYTGTEFESNFKLFFTPKAFEEIERYIRN